MASVIEIIDSSKNQQEMLKPVSEKLNAEQDIYRSFEYSPPSKTVINY